MNESENGEALIKLDNKKPEYYNECCPIKTIFFSCKDQVKPWIYQLIKKYTEVSEKL